MAEVKEQAGTRGAPAGDRRRGGLRISLRTKVLALITVLLLAAMGTYLTLATTLFRRDKLAYVYDLNAALVETLGEQTRGQLEFLGEKARWYALEAERGEWTEAAHAAAAQALFRRDPDVVRVRVLEPATAGGAPVVRYVNRSDAALTRAGIAGDGLDRLDRVAPLDAEVVMARPDELLVQNASLPPDVGLLTVAVVHRTTARTSVVALDLRHDRLLRLFARSAVQLSYLVDARGRVVSHPDAARVVARTVMADHPLVQTALRSQAARGVMEFVAPDHSRRLGAYGQVGTGGLHVLVEVSRDEALRAGRELVRRSLLFGLAIVLAAFVVSIGFARLLTAPLRKLRAATEVIGQGRFDADVEIRSRDEIGDLGHAFGKMARDLKQTQAQLVQSGKLAAFGQLGAGITHEVKNPVAGIVSLAQVAQKRLDQPEKTREILQMIEKEGLRCRDILVNFLRFARTDAQGLEALEPNSLVTDVAKIIRHQLGTHEVKLHVELAPELPRVSGSAGGLSQVLLNLALNAQQAMPKGGQVWVRTARAADGGVVLSVTDDGPGIPPEVVERIFEPFFTTKAPGEGTGLGLSVSHGIVRSHGGTLTVESVVGQGTTFSVRLPALAAEPAAAPAPPPGDVSGPAPGAG